MYLIATKSVQFKSKENSFYTRPCVIQAPFNLVRRIGYWGEEQKMPNSTLQEMEGGDISLIVDVPGENIDHILWSKAV